ncbi:MAG: TPM domain-containing protein [Rikenellaceae bacterium]
MKFLTKKQEKRVVAAIVKAEKQTSAEIKVHIDKSCKGDPLERAKELFLQLEMDQTELRNGVLIYVSEDRTTAIVGDQGINEKVSDDFWIETHREMVRLFAKGDRDGALCSAIESAGERLKEFFPYQEDDINELSDEISYEK